MNIVSQSRITKLLDEKVNSKAISIYFILAYLCLDQDGTCYILDFNYNKIVRFMKLIGIKTTNRQVKASISELLDAGMISFPYADVQTRTLDHNILIINDLLIDVLGEEYKRYIKLNQFLVSSEFYHMPVVSKRMSLYILKRFTGPFRKTTENILNSNVYDYLSNILSINRPQKIRDALNHPTFKKYINARIINSHYGNEVYEFEITNTFCSMWEYELVDESLIQSFNPKAKYIVMNYLHYLKTIPKAPNIQELLKNLFMLKNKRIKIISKIFLDNNDYKEIKKIQRYLSKIIYDNYLESNTKRCKFGNN